MGGRLCTHFPPSFIHDLNQPHSLQRGAWCAKDCGCHKTPCKWPLPLAVRTIHSKCLHFAIIAWNGSSDKWEGLLTQHIVSTAVLTIPPPFWLHYWLHAVFSNIFQSKGGRKGFLAKHSEKYRTKETDRQLFSATQSLCKT